MKQVIVLSLLCLASYPSVAATNNFALMQPAAANCVGPLPSFDANLRKRPAGILNEGSANAFLTCGMPNDVFASVWRVDAQFFNRGTQTVTITCTMAAGLPWDAAVYYVDDIQLPANSIGFITFDRDVDNDGEYFQSPQAMSCVLPPKVEINTSGVIFTKETN